ncbi:MAG: hypothetical protein RMX68_028525 [Aulosira sp. ZfuVER01]|nr:hypothetical protein [Aulosira sp. ZfuVER01]MDZ7997663.1 hypothetical protein [Aulosira sp. DedVER01a]MDZ8055354.1 hypothetical protein [Aulosira sp. ZfuCHP01]
MVKYYMKKKRSPAFPNVSQNQFILLLSNGRSHNYHHLCINYSLIAL